MYPHDYRFKVVLLGDSCVGKSSLLSRFIFNELTSLPTIGIEFSTKKVVLDGKNIKAQIWDINGNERFRSLLGSYCSKAHGAILVYDISDRLTFENIEQYMLPTVRENAPKDVVIMLIGNKSDLHQNRQVSTEEGKTFADKYGLCFIETSAVDSKNVELTFQTILKDIYENKINLTTAPPASVDLPLPQEKSCYLIVQLN